MDAASISAKVLGEIREAGGKGASSISRARAAESHRVCDQGDLIPKAQSYDQEALSQIYETYYPKVYSFAYVRLNNAAEAEDVASYVMLQVLESIHRYQHRGFPFSAWVFRIARNHVIDLYRRRSRRPEVELPDGLVSDAPAPEEIAEWSAERNQLWRALAQIGEDQRQVIMLRFIHGLEIFAVAKVMERSEAAVKSLQHRGLVALKRILDDDEVSCSG